MLLFQILECVTINLTFVYALFAHAHIKQTNLCTILVSTTIIIFLVGNYKSSLVSQACNIPKPMSVDMYLKKFVD